MPDESTKNGFWSTLNTWFNRHTRLRKILYGVGTLAILPLFWAFLADVIKPKIISMLSVERVTILMPVQGDPRPTDESNLPFEDKISNDIVQTLSNAKSAFDLKNQVRDEKVKFVTYPEGRNADERLQIARAQIAQAASEKRPVVAIIGHTTSQATLDTSSVYADNGISVLIPYATKSGIAEEVSRPGANGKRVPRALAFPPSNKSQAKSIADFLRDRGARSIVVFRDAANRAYSDDCANELVKILENDATADGKNPIEVVADVAVGGEFGRWYNTQDVTLANADAYVIISMAKPSLEIVRQVVRSPFPTWPKFIVLTDGAIDDYLVPRISRTLQTHICIPPCKKDEEKFMKFPPVYIFFPESDVQPKGYEAIFKQGNGVRGLSHSAYLTDAIFVAYAVARDTLETATRGNAAAIFAKKLDDFIGYNGPVPTVTGAQLLAPSRYYTFLKTGSRASDAAYTLFQLDPQTLHDPAQQGYMHPTSFSNADIAH